MICAVVIMTLLVAIMTESYKVAVKSAEADYSAFLTDLICKESRLDECTEYVRSKILASGDKVQVDPPYFDHA